MRSWFRPLVCAMMMVTLSGCAGQVRDFVVTQRNEQGDRAYNRTNYKDAALAYRLALQVDPNDQHAREGLAQVQTQLAAIAYRDSRFDDALDALAVATKYDPQGVRVAQLRTEVEQAKLKRSIVISNYPAYRETGFQLRHSYQSLRKIDGAIVASLQRFSYTYDAEQLNEAIRQSYTLNEEVTHLTSRLVNYRQLVEAGAPQKGMTPLAPASSLLPLP